MLFFSVFEYLEDMVLVFLRQLVLIAVLDEFFRCVDEQHLVVGACPFAQHDDAGGDAHAEEEVRRQLDDRVHEVVLHQPLTNGALLAPTVEDTRKLYDGCRAALGEGA